ncbi:MAG: CAF17-like 4Fe-4S cluster assembly/insertion protein YgfZ [Rhodospirillaceae bacterium]
MASFTTLPHRAVVAVHGDDRLAFLQGLISNDMAKVENGEAVWAAFLTPQGKFLHEFFVVARGDAVILECERARRDDLVTRLSRYRLRAKATVAADPSAVAVAWGEDAASALETTETPGAVKASGAGILYTDPRVRGAGIRAALTDEQIAAWAKHPGLARSTPEAYDSHRLALGLPDGSRDMEIEKALLLENGFAELHGVDFKKGCYIGQELTARTHYRALIKKRLMPVTIAGGTPAPGAAITAAGIEAGELKSVRGDRGLALIKLDAWRKVPDGVLEADGAKITPFVPAWMTITE